MEKIWLKSYPPGVAAEINPDAYQSIVEVFLQSCKNYHDRPAFSNFGVTFTYKQMDQYTRDFAAYLQNKLNLKKGERVAIMMPNLLQYPVALFGVLRAGLIVVNVNPLYTADELTHQMNDSGASTIVVLANFAHTVSKALPRMPALKNIIVTEVGDLFPWVKATLVNFLLRYVYKQVPEYQLSQALSFKTVMKAGKHLGFVPPALNNKDIAFLQYTGGTTGVSKGAILTHRNIIANIQQASAWFKGLLTERNEIVITALPLYHIFSLTANCVFFTKMGGLNVLITNPRDIPGMIKTIKKIPFTAFTAVNTLFNALLKNPKIDTVDFSHLRLALGGGMSVQKVVAERWQALTHAPLLEAYGLTEASPCVTINPCNLHGYNGTIGLPVPSTDICIIGPEGQEMGIGEAGELAVKGPQVMQGYWQNPKETAKVFTKEGWLLTGDIAIVDSKGFIRLMERKKDMIIVSGFNVYPNEVEDVLVKINGVREAAVIGVQDQNSGEVPKAFVVKDLPSLTEDEIIDFCRQHLTAYKIPRSIEFVNELPKSYVGKILRRALRVPS